MGSFPKHKLIWSFLPFYFRVCAFSISRTRLSRSLDQATTNLGHGPRGRMMKLFMITLVDTKNSLYQALIQQPAGFFFAAHHLWSARYVMLFLHFLVRCLFSSVLQLLFLCKAKIKYMSRRQSKYVINKYIVHVSNCQKKWKFGLSPTGDSIKHFLCPWRSSWEETWFPRKLKAGGEKIIVGNKRLSIIYWEACWRNFTWQNHICGGKYGGGHTLPLGNSTSFNS